MPWRRWRINVLAFVCLPVTFSLCPPAATAQTIAPTVTIGASPGSVLAGEMFTAIVTATNNGPVAAAPSATILQVGEFVSASAPPGWQVTIAQFGEPIDYVVFRGDSPVPIGGTVTFSVSMRLSTAHTPGEIIALRVETVFTQGSSHQAGSATTEVIVAGAAPLPAAASPLMTLAGPLPLAALADDAQDAVFDPVSGAYVIVHLQRTAPFSTHLGGLIASRLDPVGNPIAGPVEFYSAPSESASAGVRLAYSPDLTDGSTAGGAMVVWAQTEQAPSFEWKIYAMPLFASSLTSGARGTVNASQLIPGGSRKPQPSIAYSPTSRVFLVIWTAPGGSPSQDRAVARRIGLDAQPVGPVIELGPGSPHDVAWNPQTNEFGVTYSRLIAGIPSIEFVRVAADGSVRTRVALATFARESADVAVNPATGNYIAVWAQSHLAAAEIGATGRVLSRGVIVRSGNLDHNRAGHGLAYNDVTGTFLLVARVDFFGDIALELNGHGAPLSAPKVLDRSQDVSAVSRTDAAEWLVIRVGGTLGNGEILGSPTRDGGSTMRLGGCTNSDPFAAFGGGACFNGGWLPPGLELPNLPAPAPPSTTDCLTPDPFVALGGGTCVGGGWHPPGSIPTLPIPAPPTPTSPTPGGCLTPDPFVALGGGTCANGGWYPPAALPPVLVPGGCLTPDPFVAIGGGICLNGGWRPKH